MYAVAKCEGDDFLYDESRGFSSGHYHSSDLQAMSDFLERARSGWNYERKMRDWTEQGDVGPQKRAHRG